MTPRLQVPGRPEVFAIGDVAATDPLRGFRPRRRRWGSVLGVQPEGLDVFSPAGHAFRFPSWSIEPGLQPWIEWGIYRGVRDAPAET